MKSESVGIQQMSERDIHAIANAMYGFQRMVNHGDSGMDAETNERGAFNKGFLEGQNTVRGEILIRSGQGQPVERIVNMTESPADLKAGDPSVTFQPIRAMDRRDVEEIKEGYVKAAIAVSGDIFTGSDVQTAVAKGRANGMAAEYARTLALLGQSANVETFANASQPMAECGS